MIRLIKNFSAMETSADLKRNKITLSDYNEIHSVLVLMSKGKPTNTISESVAKWFKRNGANVNVVPTGWNISFH